MGDSTGFAESIKAAPNSLLIEVMHFPGHTARLLNAVRRSKQKYHDHRQGLSQSVPPQNVTTADNIAQRVLPLSWRVPVCRSSCR